MKGVIKRSALVIAAVLLHFSLAAVYTPALSAAAPNVGTAQQLSDTIEDAQNGDSIVLISNITLTQELIINKAVTIDTRDYSINVSTAKLICKAGTIKGKRAPVKVTSGGRLELNSGASITTEQGDAVVSTGGGIVHICGGTVNGSVSYSQGPDITMKDGSVTNGLFLNQFTSFKLMGGIINNGVKAKSGTITFDGGTIKGDDYGIRAEDGLILNMTSGAINANNGNGIELHKGATADIKGGTVSAKHSIVIMEGTKISVVTSYSSINGIFSRDYNRLISPLSQSVDTKMGNTETVKIDCLENYNFSIDPDTPSVLYAEKTAKNTFAVTPSKAGSFLLSLRDTAQSDVSISLEVPVIAKRRSIISSSSIDDGSSLSNNFYQDTWKTIQEQLRFTPRPTIPETGVGNDSLLTAIYILYVH